MNPISRKLIVTYVEMGIIVISPLVYQKCGVANDVQMLVLGMIGVAAGLYKGANILEKKLNGADDAKGP